jgi:uncharacterized protein
VEETGSAQTQALPAADYRPLQPGQLSVFRVRTALFFLPLALLTAQFDYWASHEVGPLRGTELPFGIMSGAAFLLALAACLFLPPRRYRAWGYREGEDELHIRHGLMFRGRIVVPFVRVQHLDIAQGPVERRFGLARLILHTAGTRSAAIPLPGLAHKDAEELRDRIRAQMRKDLL